MKQKKLKIGLLAAGCVAVSAVTVSAITTSLWNHPCPGLKPLTCDDPCAVKVLPPECCPNCPLENCRCEGDFNNDAHWTSEAPFANVAVIIHSNAVVTDEEWLEMAFVSTPVHTLRITTKDTGGNDALDIRFNNAATITVSHEVQLSATNGAITLGVDSAGTITTQ